MAWDGVSQTVVALDTGSATAAVVPGTWTWDGDSWTREATSVRPLRPWAMAYDAARRKVVAFADDGTWLWDGSASARTWTKHPTTTTPTMNHARLAYDAKRKRVVLFGGESPPKNETWTWDGTAWTQQDPRTDPPGRSRMGMAYHAQSERVVVFGGAATQGSLNDTWTYAANWRRVA